MAEPARGDDAPPSTSKHQEQSDTLTARAVTINRPAHELFAYWRDFANLATFMDNVERVDVIDDRRSHWVVKAPAGKTVEWTARITDVVDGQSIAWEAEEDADVPNSGRVEFRDAGQRGTVVTATILYDPPAGAFGKVIAKLFQREPAIQARRDLRRFKQLMETGEIATGSWTKKQLEEERN